MDKIGKYLLSLAAFKADVSAVGREYVKVSEALHAQKRVAFRLNRKAKVGKLLFYLILVLLLKINAFFLLNFGIISLKINY